MGPGPLSDFDKLIPEFCNILIEQAKKKNRDAIDEIRNAGLTGTLYCTEFFEKCILAENQNPIVLAIDEADLLFEYRDTCDNFFGMLRAWADSARSGSSEDWEKFKLAIAYSTEAKIDPSRSPFNFGIVMNLKEFNVRQIVKLAKECELDWGEEEVKELMQIIGGHPYMVRKALYEFALGRIKNFKDLERTAAYSKGPFGDHLRRYSWKLKQKPEWVQLLKRVLMNENCGDTDNCNQLSDLGLLTKVVRKFEFRFKVYKDYFRQSFKI
jgi:serine/threonine-protein kinase